MGPAALALVHMKGRKQKPRNSRKRPGFVVTPMQKSSEGSAKSPGPNSPNVKENGLRCPLQGRLAGRPRGPKQPSQLQPERDSCRSCPQQLEPNLRKRRLENRKLSLKYKLRKKLMRLINFRNCRLSFAGWSCLIMKVPKLHNRLQ